MTRNIVMVSIDSLRADRCGFLGGDGNLTPALDRMAEDGVSFENAIAPGPKTPESMPTVFTGRQWTSAGDEFDLNSWHDDIRPHMGKRESIAQHLSREGYETIAYTPNGFTTEYFGFDQGFDYFEDFLDDEIRPGFDIPNALRGLIKFVNKEGNWKTWERYYEDVLDSVESASEPYFLWVFLLDVHSPYLVPREYRRENSFLDMMAANWRRSKAGDSDGIHDKLVSAYDDTVRYGDEFLRRLVSDLDDTDPVYVVHSDHGEAFGDHGHYGHERLLYRENLHVPFCIGNAGMEDHIDRPVSLQIIPEILEAIAGDELDSLLAEFDRDPWRNPVLAHTEEGGRTAVRVGPYKYIADHDGGSVLYDLDDDPEERTDRSAEFPAIHSLLAEYERRFARGKAEEATIEDMVTDLAASGQI